MHRGQRSARLSDENLRLAIARMENPVYSEPEEDQKQEAPNLKLVRRGHGEYVLLSAL